MMTETFLDRLATALRDQQMPAERVTDLVTEVATHLAESREDPLQAFGAPETLAIDLAARHGDGDPDARTGALQPMEVASGIRERGIAAGNKAPVYTQRAQWCCVAGPDDVLDRSVQVVTDRSGTVVDRADRELTARLGSRIAFRLLGQMLAAGRSRLPMRLQLTVTPTSAGTDVDAVVTEDSGWAVAHVGMDQGAYEQSFEALLKALLTATTGTTTAPVENRHPK